MPYSDADFVQMKTGNGTTVTVDTATTVGNTVKVFAANADLSASVTAITGFTRDMPTGSAARLSAWTKTVTTGETSWTITTTVAVAWVVIELPGSPWPVDIASSGVAGSLTTTNINFTSTYDGVGFALHMLYNSTGGSAGTLGSHTGGFEEIAEQTATDGTKAVDFSLSRRWLQSLVSPQVTATASGVTPTLASSNLVIYSAPGARRAADVSGCMGAEIGSTAGMAVSNLTAQMYADATAGATIEAAAARTGNFGFRCQSTAAAAYVQWTTTGLVLYQVMTSRVSFRFRSALPGGDIQLADQSGFIVRYRSASGKIGVQFAGGTEQLSDAAVGTGQWISLDSRVDRTGTTYLCDWQVTYGDGTTPVAQTQAASPAGQTANVKANFTIGSTTAQTADFDWDDFVTSRYTGHYPLGDMRIYPLKVDPAGTLTISGTAANFNTFTANGTMAAWNATTARDAIDDIPPTIGAAADGIAQVTLAASDYVEIPLETLNLAAIPGTLRHVRLSFSGWAASATASTLGFDAYDGTTVYSGLIGTADYNFDNATAVWVTADIRSAGGLRVDWTQARLDGLCARVGFSSDATPDVGIHAVIAEAVVRVSDVRTVFGDMVTAAVDPDSGGLVTVTVTAPAMGTGDASLVYEESGTPTTVPVPEGTTVTETINAPDAPTVNRITMYWPPEPDPIA